MSVPASRRAGDRRGQDVRRLRDLLRSALLADRFRDGALPSETALMSAYGATRATVREALGMLRAEGLIERLPGVGTHVMVDPPRTEMDEALGVTRGGAMYAFTTPPRILDRSTVPAPATLAASLGVDVGTPVLRLEYVAMSEGLPTAVATNYMVYPEAERLLATPFHGHWYQLMADAGVVLGESEFVIDCVAADPMAAELLGVAPGFPLLAMEQTIADPSGRVIDVAFLRIRADRFRFVSRATASDLL
ncbi:GntR family transcriptional regulator [Pseudonocardia kujensis]|uniref:GntR family transcriptional regulator n=1 Tax=Pseudonocardia kujensis TaxID=1128675 RepID=UPI001E2F0BA7|nr:GntR family transcriptional regulator [Pseudonocardia kujensis]MCE0768199.1 GntR family transcriptional regulator [Pseudonocardia kujensis]